MAACSDALPDILGLLKDVGGRSLDFHGGLSGGRGVLEACNDFGVDTAFVVLGSFFDFMVQLVWYICDGYGFHGVLGSHGFFFGLARCLVLRW